MIALHQSMTASDPELQDMVGRDVSLVLRRYPDLKPALAQAYASASPDGMAFVKRQVQTVDPTFLSTLGK
jgi:hypothetical protein